MRGEGAGLTELSWATHPVICIGICKSGLWLVDSETFDTKAARKIICCVVGEGRDALRVFVLVRRG